MAVIGEEGNGKSTLLKLIYEQEQAAGYVEYQGEILTGNATIGYLAQELGEEEKEQSVWEFFSENPAFYNQKIKNLSGILLCRGKNGAIIRRRKSKTAACRNSDAKSGDNSAG